MVRTLGPTATKQILQLANMSPSAQRFVIGVTGLVGQTTIDALNPYVDENTRKYAAVRTAVKMVITTSSGVLTRQIGQRLGEYIVKTGKAKIPEGVSKLEFASSLGKVFAIAGAVVSIFLIDVPFINKLLNFTMEKLFKVKKPTSKISKTGGVNYNA